MTPPTPAEKRFLVAAFIGFHFVVLVLIAAAIVALSATLCAVALVAVVSWWVGFACATIVATREPV